MPSSSADAGEVSVVITRGLQWQLAVVGAALRFPRWLLAAYAMLVAFLIVLASVTGAWSWSGLLPVVGAICLLVAAYVLTQHAMVRATCPVGATVRGSHGDGLVFRGPTVSVSYPQSQITRTLQTRHATAFKIGTQTLTVPRAFGRPPR